MRTLVLILIVALSAACITPTRGGALATPESHATDEGALVLLEGGNAMDAAVCVGFVLAVTHPMAGNLGGGGFLLVHSKKNGDQVIDARETAPRAAKPNMYLDKNGDVRKNASLVGPLASGVPGSVAGYLKLLDSYGTMDRKRLLAPAIRLAEEGFKVDEGLHRSLLRHKKLLQRFKETRRVYLPGGQVPRPGQTLRQPELAKVLRAIAEKGSDGFYKGWFAQKLQDTNRRYGGILTVGDLATYKLALRAPLRRDYRGHQVLTMPPPSSGGVVLLQILDMLDHGVYEGMRREQGLHLFAEVSRRAFADRARYFGDPDFVDVPVNRLLDERYLEQRYATVDMARATPSSSVQGGLQFVESDQTCHFSIVDGAGNAVSVTTTLNGAYGCGLAVSGVLLNNEMDDFTVKEGAPNQFGLVQGKRNAIAPRKRPLSSMTPTILLKNGDVQLVLGSPGGPTIISSVAQVIAYHIAGSRTLGEAVAEPRIHCQWLPDEVLHERLTAAEERALTTLGHTLRLKQGPMGDVQAVGRDKSGRLLAVSDPRGRGKAVSGP